MSPPPLPDELLIPHPERCDPTREDYTEILRRHAHACAAGYPGYRDPTTGDIVMTARGLWERGYCCDMGCRHCPWIPRP